VIITPRGPFDSRPPGISYAVQAYEVESPVSGNTRSFQSEHCQVRVDIDNLGDDERAALKIFIEEIGK